MKPKKHTKQSVKSRFWLFAFIILLASVLIGGALLFNSYVNQQTEQKENAADNIRYAKIETFVDLVKNRLDQEIPEGKWQIDKYCTKPGTKGDFDTYSCFYHVVSERGIEVKTKMKQILASYYQNGSVNEYHSDLSQTTGYGGNLKIEGGCGMTISDDNALVSVGCSSSSHTVRYTLLN